jgi:hypothetical protein
MTRNIEDMLGKQNIRTICVEVQNCAGDGNKIAILLPLLPALLLVQYWSANNLVIRVVTVARDILDINAGNNYLH